MDQSNFATRADSKRATDVDTSDLAAKSNLASIKTEVDKIDIDKPKTVPANLSKLCHAVDNDIVKKNVYEKLVTKVNAIDTSGFVLKTQYNTDKSGLEKNIDEAGNRIPDNSEITKKTDYNVKITGVERKISNITGLASTTAIPNVSDPTDYDEIMQKMRH